MHFYVFFVISFILIGEEISIIYRFNYDESNKSLNLSAQNDKLIF